MKIVSSRKLSSSDNELATVVRSSGRLASTRQIYQQLLQIFDGINSTADFPVAVLATTEQDDCARAMVG